MLQRLSLSALLLASLMYLASCGSDDPVAPAPQPQVDCSSLAVTLSGTTAAVCDSPGSAEVAASGGASPYTFAIDGGSFQGAGTFAGLAAGSYSVTAQDANDCTVSLTLTIADASGDLSISASQTAAAGCGTSSGEIAVTLDQGSGTVEYSLDGGAFSANATFAGLSADTYQITARNEEGCETTTSAQVLSGITLSGHVQDIIDTNCALPTCHGGGRFPDFRQKTNILNNAASIASRTASGSMPPTGALDQATIDIIACWVADGALDN